MLRETDKRVTVFNKGDIKAIVNTFLSEGELIDEQGVLHSGHEQISAPIGHFSPIATNHVTRSKVLPREWASFCIGRCPKPASGACKTLGNQAEPSYQLVVIP
jgi:hypothetical protein